MTDAGSPHGSDASRGLFVSELLVPLPSEGGQVLAVELAGHFAGTHGYGVLGPRDGSAVGQPVLAQRTLGVRGAVEIARRRPGHVVYMPRSGLTPASVVRLALVRALRPRSTVSFVVTQLHVRPTARWVWAAVRRLANDVLVATPDQVAVLGEHRVTADLLGLRIARDKVSSRDRAEAREVLSLGGDGPVYLHVGHGRHGRGLEHLTELAPPGRTVLVLSSAFPEEDGAVPRDAAITVVRGHVTDVADYYRAADVYVFPTRSAKSVIGVPMSVIEAMSNGTPVVALRSEVTDRLAGSPGLVLCETVDEMVARAHELAGSPDPLAASVAAAGTDECAGDFATCRGSGT
jgi:hypothetical protein